MKYKVPKEAAERVRALYTRGDFWDDSALEVANFLDSIPDEFEIIGPGERAVVWPADLTRERLFVLARSLDCQQRDDAIRRLAAIAPEAPKKRMVNLWRYHGMTTADTLHGQLCEFPINGPEPGGFPWRKVNHEPVEVDE